MSIRKRPGDYLKPGEDELEGLKRRLDERLAPIEGQYEVDTSGENDWEIGDCLAQWWRPNFETFMVRRPWFCIHTQQFRDFPPPPQYSIS